MNNYFELKISINPEIEDIVSDICFSNFVCEGVLLAEETYDDTILKTTTRGVLKVFLTEITKNPVEILKTEREILKFRGFTDEELGSWDIELNEKENQDWSKKWKEKWTVTPVTDKVIIVPSWIDYESKQDEVIVKINPGNAFGTGAHQTTQLCMKALEKYFKPGSKMADIGTGSGILAILAMKLGANSAYGCDNDDTVIETCYENAELNNVSIEFEFNTADKLTEKFDFVCANILHNILADIMGDLKNILNKNGIIALSGILDEKRDVVLEAVKREGLTLIDEIHQDQWVSLICQKP